MDFSDTEAFPYSDPRRTWHSSDKDLAPDGAHYDPGVKLRDRILEKASSRQKEYQDAPPLEELVDVSRMRIVFNSVQALLTAHQDICRSMELSWIENMFANPCVSGYRDINIGVQQDVGRRMHVT